MSARLLVLASFATLTGCGTRPHPVLDEPFVGDPVRGTPADGARPTPGASEHAVEHADFVLVYLLTNPEPTGLTPEAQSAAMNGHFANMGRMAEVGDLLVAGPLGEPRARDDHRGIFLLDAATVDFALELAASDPAVEAGVFVLEAHPLTTTSRLRELSALDAAAQARRLAAAPDGPKWAGRAYVLASTPAADAAERALAGDSRVLFQGRLGGARDGELLVALDAENVEQANGILGAAQARTDRLIEWTLSPWYATPAVADLAPE